MKRVPTIFLLSVALMLCGCTNVKNKKVTAENKDKIFEEIKNSKQLSVEEVQLLQAYVLRHAMASAFSQQGGSSDEGKTIGQMIEEQRKWITDEKVREEEDRQKREKAKAEAENQRKLLRDALSVTLYEKGFQSGSFQDYITLKMSYQNTSGKDIRGFKGTVVFQDLFGDAIKQVNLKEDDIVKASETKRVGRTLNYNQFISADAKLRSTEMDNLKAIWNPDLILFTDGTSLKIDAADE